MHLHLLFRCASETGVVRLLDEPRPLVVNISWVVECVEKRERIDESRFSVDLEAINVAGANKVCSLPTVDYSVTNKNLEISAGNPYCRNNCQPWALWTCSWTTRHPVRVKRNLPSVLHLAIHLVGLTFELQEYEADFGL